MVGLIRAPRDALCTAHLTACSDMFDTLTKVGFLPAFFELVGEACRNMPGTCDVATSTRRAEAGLDRPVEGTDVPSLWDEAARILAPPYIVLVWL